MINSQRKEQLPELSQKNLQNELVISTIDYNTISIDNHVIKKICGKIQLMVLNEILPILIEVLGPFIIGLFLTLIGLTISATFRKVGSVALTQMIFKNHI